MSIRLAFSGGGFRATLFHLGVVRYLRERNLLKDIDSICSVSGGSILAAHLVLNWHKYRGNSESFQEATTEVVKFSQSDVRGRIVRAWVFGWSLAIFLWLGPVSLILYFVWNFNNLVAALGSIAWLVVGHIVIDRCKHLWSLVRALERGYNTHLYRKLQQQPGRSVLHTAVLADLKQTATAPTLHILTTDLTTGGLGSFDERGFHIYTPQGIQYDVRDFIQNQLPIGRAVAASSAFPVLFSPVRLSNRDFGGATTFSNPQMLADGGIFENFGLEGFVAVYSGKAWPGDCTLLLSDGQAVFNPEDLRNFALLDSRASRTIDVLMHRVSLWQLNQAVWTTEGTTTAAQPGLANAAGVGAVTGPANQPVTASSASGNPGLGRPFDSANPATNPVATANLVAVVAAANRFGHISLATNVQGDWALNPSPLQNRIARTRTDLDAFSHAEVHLLVYQGFCAARAFYEPATQDGTLGVQRLPPDNAYTEGWKPTAPLSDHVRELLNTNAVDDVLGTPSRFKAAVKELIAPLNWATFLVMVLGIVTFYPMLTLLINWWESSSVQPASWPLQFVEPPTGNHAVAVLVALPAINDLWNGIAPSCTQGCKMLLLRTRTAEEVTNGHSIKEGPINLKCTRQGDEWAGGVFLVRPYTSEPASCQLLFFSSDFHVSRKIQLPRASSKAYLIAILKIKSSGPFEDLAALLEIKHE